MRPLQARGAETELDAGVLNGAFSIALEQHQVKRLFAFR